MNIQWYPGHMTKTRRQMAEYIKQVDAVCEVVDARIPQVSRNPDMDEIAAGKPRMMILNRIDLADPNMTAVWAKHFREQGMAVIQTDSRSGNGTQAFSGAVRTLLADKIAQWNEKGLVGKSVRVMVVGIPNVGKSTFINRILGRKSAKAADRPGVTRGSQWFRVESGIDLLDTPGILWPKFDDERVGILLACTGAIKDDILDVETLGCKLMELLAEQAPQTIIDRYSIAIPEEECDFLGYELLQQAGRRRGFLLRGGEIDTERMARILLDEFRGGVLGRITLEKPEKPTFRGRTAVFALGFRRDKHDLGIREKAWAKVTSVCGVDEAGRGRSQDRCALLRSSCPPASSRAERLEKAQRKKRRSCSMITENASRGRFRSWTKGD
ncbi:MAG: ribosome biogenesis GTPase YlqF [Butyricicoccaceae bacterium]